MMKFRWHCMVLLFLLGAGCSRHAERPVAASVDILFRGVVVIDPGTGGRLRDHDVLVDDGRIVAVRPSTPEPPAADHVVQGQGRYLMPGLWDMHAHWYDESSLPLFTLNGVTGLRLMRGEVAHYAWRARGLEGTPAAPRLYLASPLVDGKPPTSQPAFEVDTPERAREVVAQVDGSAADFLKVYDKVPRVAYLALVDEALKRGVRVEGHVPVEVSWQEAARLGVQRSFEHLHSLPVWAAAQPGPLHRRWLDYYRGVDYNRGLSREDRLESADIHADAYDGFDAPGFAAMARVLAEKRIWQSPTCILWQARDARTREQYESDPRMRRVPGWMRGWWSGWLSQDPEVQAVEAVVNRRRTAYCLDRVRDFHRLGVPLLAGTDVMMPYVFAGTGLHDELALMVEAGLTPAQALATATSGPAEFIGRDDIGAIRAGALADMVLLEADPLLDISALGRIQGVVVGGRWVGADERVRMLARIERILAAPAASSELASKLSESGLDAAFAHYATLCPSDPEQRDCGGFNVAYEMAMALSEHSEKARHPELVAWIARTFPTDPDALFWAASQYAERGLWAEAIATLDTLSGIAPGYPLTADLRVRWQASRESRTDP